MQRVVVFGLGVVPDLAEGVLTYRVDGRKRAVRVELAGLDPNVRRYRGPHTRHGRIVALAAAALADRPPNGADGGADGEALRPTAILDHIEARADPFDRKRCPRTLRLRQLSVVLWNEAKPGRPEGRARRAGALSGGRAAVARADPGGLKKGLSAPAWGAVPRRFPSPARIPAHAAEPLSRSLLAPPWAACNAAGFRGLARSGGCPAGAIPGPPRSPSAARRRGRSGKPLILLGRVIGAVRPKAAGTAARQAPGKLWAGPAKLLKLLGLLNRTFRPFEAKSANQINALGSRSGAWARPWAKLNGVW